MKQRIATLIAAAAAAAAGHAAMGQTAPILSGEVKTRVDSGPVASPAAGNGAALVWSHVLQVPHVPWLRLQFQEVMLAGQQAAGDGAYLLITSLHDGGQQRLDARSIREWYHTSAYFNGDSVLIELYAYPGVGQSRVSIAQVTAGVDGIGPHPETICGPTDDRQLSNEAANARLMPIGCTAWLIDLGNCANRFLTAGHCISAGTTNAVVQFNVPLSTAGGTPVAPPPQHQYPAISTSIQSSGSGGVGFDAAQFFTAANSVTNQAPRFAQNAAYTLASAAPTPTNQVTRITGYGVTSTPVSPTWSQVQKTHTGALVSRTPPSSLQYTADTTGGNSGSPVVLEATGQAMGIHTHGGCTSTGGANSGTAIDWATIQGYLANPLPGCIPFGPLAIGHTPFTLIAPGTPTVLAVQVTPNTQQVVPGSPTMHYRFGPGAFTSIPLTPTTGNNYQVTLPAAECTDTPQYYFTAQGDGGANVSLPANAPTELFTTSVGVVNQQVTAITSFETGLPVGWSVTGLWNITTNTCGAGSTCDGTSLARYSNANCTFNTGVANQGNLTSGLIQLPAIAPGETLTLEYCSALTTENAATWDLAQVFVNNVMVDEPPDTPGFENRSANIAQFAGQNVTIRFFFNTVDAVANDFPGWRVDNIRVRKAAVECETCYPDCNQSGGLTIADFACFQAAFAGGNPYADCNQSGGLTIADFACFQAAFSNGCP